MKRLLLSLAVKRSCVLVDENFESCLGSLSKVCKESRWPFTIFQEDPTATRPYDVFCFGKILLSFVTGYDYDGGLNYETNKWLKEKLAGIHMGLSMWKLIENDIIFFKISYQNFIIVEL